MMCVNEWIGVHLPGGSPQSLSPAKMGSDQKKDYKPELHKENGMI